MLVVPDQFEGEVFLLADASRGVQWIGGPLEVPASGVLLISNLDSLAAIRPDAFDARYSSGKRIENRNRGGDYDRVGLWPVSSHEDKNRLTEMIYFVVGTFDAKTTFENDRMKDWPRAIALLRAGKRLNQISEVNGQVNK